MKYQASKTVPMFFSIILFLPFLFSGNFSSANEESVSRQVTEQDLPRIPHVDSADALGTFRMGGGFQLELVAAEPLVSDPVDASFDEFGRMYVAEMHGYPFSYEPTKLNPKGGGKLDAGIIRLLEDTNGDGQMDRSVVFADKISWPTSVCCYNGGVFVTAPPYLYYFKDTDGNNQADIREEVLAGFGRGNVQAVANSMKWGLDNKIYFAAGRNPNRLTHRGEPLFSVGGSDLRFDPKTEKFERITGGQQFGHSFDDWGTRFVCSNSNHIQQVIFSRRYLDRNPYLAVSGAIRNIAVEGPASQVFRTSPPEPWRIVRQKWRAADKGYKLVFNEEGGWDFIPLDPSKKSGVLPTETPTGNFTSATGITIYRGNAYPEEYRGNAFIGDVGGNLVHRKTVTTDHVVYQAKRADIGQELLSSSDNWCRPVSFVNGPDGSLMILDMYRETIEHPFSIPEEIKQYLYLTSGSDRGRIYRLVSPNMKRIKPTVLGKLSSAELVAELSSGNGWNRETAQRLLWERQDRSVVPKLEELLTSANNPLGRLHALYTLDGLDALTPALVRLALKDNHPRIRAHAIKLSEKLLSEPPTLLEDLLALCDDKNEFVRFQLAFSLGESEAPLAIEGLTRIAKSPNNSNEVRIALLSSVGKTADRVAVALLADAEFLKQSYSAAILTQLALIVGANPNPAPSLRLLSAATSADCPPTIQRVVLTGLGQGLNRRESSVSAVLASEATSDEVRVQVSKLFERAAKLATDEETSVVDREVAIQLLAFADYETATSNLSELLTPQTPQSLQRSAVHALAQQDSDDVVATLLDGWSTYGPQIRRDVIDALLSRATRIQALLDAVEAETVRPRDIERDKKQLLLSHPKKDIQSRSRKLFGSSTNETRAEVVQDNQEVLNLEGDVARGLEVFKKNCSVCHQVGTIGHRVAPDLVSVQNKSPGDLLIAILDPNREAQPNYNTYTVLTDGGRSYNGIIASETANSITLRRAESKEDVVLRSNIDELISTGVSLMPEGLEKDLSQQNMADVIAFIKSLKPAEVVK